MPNENIAQLINMTFEAGALTFAELCSEKVKQIYRQLQDEQQKFEFAEKLRARAVELRRKKDFETWWKNVVKVKPKTTTLPNIEDIPLDDLDFGQYGITNAGLYLYDERQGEVFFADGTPLIVSKILHNIDNEPNKVELSYKLRGKWRTVVVNRRDVIDNRAILNLANHEISVNSANAGYLVQYITKLIAQNTKKIPIEQSVGRLGWHCGEFIPYDSNYVYDGATSVLGAFKAVTTHGSYEAWLEQYSKAREYSDIVRFYVSAGLASPLLELLNVQNFLVHLWGNTEFGKTVSHMLAMSVWGNPEGMIFTFNSTLVFLERQAAFLKNIPFAINELETVKDKFTDTDRIIYQLCEGQSKGRGAKAGGTEEVKYWRLVILSNGERALTDEKSGAGAINRSLELNCKNLLYTNPAELCDCIRENYGHAGKMFIEFVKTIDYDTLKSAFKRFHSEIQRLEIMDKQTNSVSVVALADYIANRLYHNMDEATAYKDTLEFIDRIKDNFASKNEVNTAERAYDNFISWCEQNTHRFSDSDTEKERYGAFLREDGKDYICVLPTAFDEWCKVSGFQRKMVIASFVQGGLLEGNENDRYRASFKLGDRYVRGFKIVKQPIQLPNKLTPIEDNNLPF